MSYWQSFYHFTYFQDSFVDRLAPWVLIRRIQVHFEDSTNTWCASWPENRPKVIQKRPNNIKTFKSMKYNPIVFSCYNSILCVVNFVDFVNLALIYLPLTICSIELLLVWHFRLTPWDPFLTWITQPSSVVWVHLVIHIMPLPGYCYASFRHYW